MAAGDYTLTTTTKNVKGRYHTMCGTAEVDGTKRAFDMFPNSYLIDFQITGQDDASVVQVQMNVNASGTADPGNVALQSAKVKVHTCDFVATYV